MRKNIDIPDDVRWELEVLAKQEKKTLKAFIEGVLIKLTLKPKQK